MSLPIGETPFLTGQDAIDFERKLEEGLKHPAKLTPTPKLKQAIKIIKQYEDLNHGTKIN